MNEINVNLSACRKGEIIARDVVYNGEIMDDSKEPILEVKSIIIALARGEQLEYGVVKRLTDVACKSIINEDDSILEYFREIYDYDDYTYFHSINVAFYAMLIGKWIHMSQRELLDVIQAGLLHDIGKMKIPKDILNKKSKLTDAEFMIIKQHSLAGYELLKNSYVVNEEVKQAVLLHHERIDGSGYPTAIIGTDIGNYAKIIAIADVYDAMTSNRSYKVGVTPFEAFEMFSTIGTSVFEPSIVSAFLLNMSAHLIGTKVKMSNGDIGEVVYIPFDKMGSPIICINSCHIEISKNSNPHIVCFL